MEEISCSFFPSRYFVDLVFPVSLAGGSDSFPESDLDFVHQGGGNGNTWTAGLAVQASWLQCRPPFLQSLPVSLI